MDDFSRMFELTGKTALVTGSTRESVRRRPAVWPPTAHRSLSTALPVWQRRSGRRTKSDCPAENARCAVADLSQEGCAQALYEQTGPVDILMLNASVQFRRPWNEISTEEFHRQVRVNFQSSLELIQPLCPAHGAAGLGTDSHCGQRSAVQAPTETCSLCRHQEAAMSMVKNLAKQLAPQGLLSTTYPPASSPPPATRRPLAIRTTPGRSMPVFPPDTPVWRRTAAAPFCCSAPPSGAVHYRRRSGGGRRYAPVRPDFAVNAVSLPLNCHSPKSHRKEALLCILMTVRRDYRPHPPVERGNGCLTAAPRWRDRYLQALYGMTLEEVWKPIFVKGL